LCKIRKRKVKYDAGIIYKEGVLWMNNMVAGKTVIRKPFPGLNLPIFVQIQMIIVFMVIALAVLGFTTLNIINTMKLTTNQMLATDNSLLENVVNSRKMFNDLQTQYFRALMGDSGCPSEYALQGVIDILGALRGVDAIEVDKLTGKLNSFKIILRQPPSQNGYRRIVTLALEYGAGLDNMQQIISESSTAIVTKNERYSNRAKLIMIVILILSGAIATAFGSLIAFSLSRALKSIGNTAKALAIGDLTRKASCFDCPEVQKVAVELDNAIYGLRQLVLAIIRQSGDIVNSGQSLSDAASQTEDSARQVSKSMEELTNSSNEQANQVNLAMGTINNLVTLVERVSNEINYIAASSEQVVQSARLGQQSTDVINSTFYSLYTAMEQTAGAIDELSEASREISEISSVINSIAEQTTLLALNAAIEAARAGEKGKGFGVVAAEIRKLATQSKEAAELIGSLIVQMNVRTDNVVSVMQNELNHINLGKDTVLRANDNFAEIFKVVKDNINQVSDVVELATQMSEKNNATIEAISSIAAIIEENLASVEEITMTSHEQCASMVKVAVSADDLNKIAAQLQESAAKFHLGT
jgi:methyl-accepting chemotaxis protein